MDVSRLNRRFTVAKAALVVVIIVCAVSVVADLHRVSVINGALAFHPVLLSPGTSDSQLASVLASAQSTDNLTRAVNLVLLLAVLLAGVTFLRWFREAYRNVAASGGALSHSLGWATGGWFTPLLGWVIPKQITDDIWRGSDLAHTGASGSDAPVPALLNLWWAGWVLCGLLGAAAELRGTAGASLTSLRTGTYLHIAYDILNAVTAVLAVRVIAEITQRQRLRASGLATPPPPPAHPAVTGWPPPAPSAVPPPVPAAWPPPAAPDLSGSVPPPGFGRR